jgi:HEAT repeat protein
LLGIIPKTRFLLLALARSEPFLDEKPLSHWAHDLEDSDEEVRVRAAFQLGLFNGESRPVVPDLAAALCDSSVRVRIQASLALFKIGQAASEATDALARALSDSNPQVRLNAALALNRIGPSARSAIPALIAAASDEDNLAVVRPMNISVRSQAARALGRIGPEARDAIPALVEVLTDPNPESRRNGAYAIGQIGRAAVPVRAKLAACLSDEDDFVRQEVAKSLALLDAAQ